MVPVLTLVDWLRSGPGPAEPGSRPDLDLRVRFEVHKTMNFIGPRSGPAGPGEY